MDRQYCNILAIHHQTLYEVLWVKYHLNKNEKLSLIVNRNKLHLNCLFYLKVCIAIFVRFTVYKRLGNKFQLFEKYVYRQLQKRDKSAFPNFPEDTQI